MPDGHDADDFDFELDFDAAEADEGCCTILRATFLRHGQIAMTPWMPGLAEGGPAGMHFRARERVGVTIADLRLIRTDSGEREVIVEFMAGGRGREAAEAALCSWARSTGQRRVWLPSGPVEVEAPDWLSTATVRCPTCRAIWMDSTPAFWEGVRRSGHFPLICPACAHTLPQWKVDPGDASGCRGDLRSP